MYLIERSGVFSQIGSCVEAIEPTKERYIIVAEGVCGISQAFKRSLAIWTRVDVPSRPLGELPLRYLPLVAIRI